jgi:hypothetical protein
MEGVIVVLRQLSIFSAVSWLEQVDFQWDDDDEVRFVLDQRAKLDFYNASSVKQHPSFEPTILYSLSLMLSGEATNTNFIVFGLTRSGLEPTIYCTRGEHANHYTTRTHDLPHSRRQC